VRAGRQGDEAVSWRARTGSAQRAFAGAEVNGDAVFTWSDGARGLFAVVDALGHGPAAEHSARHVLEVLEGSLARTLPEIFTQVHGALEGQRGVVMSAIQVEGDEVTFLGVGNVELLAPPDWPRPPCWPGILGSGRLRVRPTRLAVLPGSRWGLVSDGIRQRDVRKAWDECAALSPPDAAYHVLEHAGRVDDDASVLVIDFFGGGG
jgi:hypothetical protein